MAIFYLDPTGGSDAGAGTSFGTRWQTLTSGATAARIAPGDVIRVKKSPDATSLGQTAAWADGTRVVTLSSAVTAAINDAVGTGWTVVTNVTAAANTNRKLGSNSQSLSANATFTTGKAAYAATSLTDYSAYQQVSFWIMQTAGTLASADGELSIKLCSDALGATAVNTINIPRIRALNTWQVVTVNTGSALGASIASVGFYINTDRGAQTFLVNHIIACKAASSPDSLTLSSLIGKGTGNEGWYAIDAIASTFITLRTAGILHNLSAAGTPSGYGGTTETVTTWKREPLQLPSALQATSTTAINFGTLNDSGTSGSVITISGGWNDTDMSTQTGDSYLDGVNGYGVGVYATGRSYWTIDKLNLYNFYYGMQLEGNTTNFTVTAKDISCNAHTNLLVNSATTALQGPTFCTFNIDNLNCAGNQGGYGLNTWNHSENNVFNVVNANSSWNTGFDFRTSYISDVGQTATGNVVVNATNLRRNGTFGIRIQNVTSSEFNFTNVTGNVNRGIQVQASSGNDFRVSGTLGAMSNTATGISLIYSSDNRVDLRGATITGNSYGILQETGSGTNTYVGGTYASGTTDFVVLAGTGIVIAPTNLPSSVTGTKRGTIRIQSPAGVVGNTITTHSAGEFKPSTAVRRTASGYSWAFTSAGVGIATVEFPLKMPVAQVAVASGSLVTVKMWVYREHTGVQALLFMNGGQITGVDNDISITAGGAIDTWEELTLTFTPSAAGVVEFEARVYSTANLAGVDAYFDDFSVTQA